VGGQEEGSLCTLKKEEKQFEWESSSHLAARPSSAHSMSIFTITVSSLKMTDLSHNDSPSPQ